ncbi:MAG: hypothetical protein FH749_00565 [Firmicutes bacterium]|nr:hypothetical protein [Bacillota bacterium]
MAIRMRKLIIIGLVIVLVAVALSAIWPPGATPADSDPVVPLRAVARPESLQPIPNWQGRVVAEHIAGTAFYCQLSYFYLIDDYDGSLVAVAVFNLPDHPSPSRIFSAILADAETVASLVEQYLPGVGLYVVAGLDLTHTCDTGCGEGHFYELFVSRLTPAQLGLPAPFPGARVLQGETWWDTHYFD